MEQVEAFKQAALPMQEWLLKNGHPHMGVAISVTGAELEEGVLQYFFEETDSPDQGPGYRDTPDRAGAQLQQRAMDNGSDTDGCTVFTRVIDPNRDVALSIPGEVYQAMQTMPVNNIEYCFRREIAVSAFEATMARFFGIALPWEATQRVQPL